MATIVALRQHITDNVGYMIKKHGFSIFAVILFGLFIAGVIYLFIVANSRHRQTKTLSVSNELPPIPIQKKDDFFTKIGSGSLLHPLQEQESPYSKNSTSPTQQDGGKSEKYSYEERFIRAVRKNEAIFEKIAVKYTLKYQFIRQYGRDWMEFPDLKRLNDEYFVHHNPIRFASGVARSANFRELFKRHSMRPEFQMFIIDVIKNTPADLIEALSDYLSANPKDATILRDFINISGIPPDVFADLKTKK